jgi:CrcB protein
MASDQATVERVLAWSVMPGTLHSQQPAPLDPPVPTPSPLANPWLAIAVGAVLGAWARYGLSLWLNPRHAWIPLGTLAANLLGGLAVGLLLGLIERGALDPAWRPFAVTGLLGALTTFSAFSAEVTGLLSGGAVLQGVLLAALHLAGSLLLTGLGLWLARLAAA